MAINKLLKESPKLATLLSGDNDTQNNDEAAVAVLNNNSSYEDYNGYDPCRHGLPV